MSDHSDSALDGLNAALPQLIPAAHRMGVRFAEMNVGRVRAEVPFEGNGNHFGVIYAGVIFTVAEVLGGAIHFGAFNTETHYPLVRSLAVDFVTPGTTALSASAVLDDAEIARIRTEAVPGAKVSFTLEGVVSDAAGAIVARTVGQYQLRPYPAAG